MRLGRALERLTHRARGFVRALVPGEPDPAAIREAESVLTPAEREVWARLGRIDRREALRVARRARALLAPRVDEIWIAAALLHDAGKPAELGAVGRAVAAALGGWVGPARCAEWARRGGWWGRVGRYLRHEEVGAAVIRAAGGRDEVAAWAGAHHHPERWAELPLPPEVAAALAAADGEPQPEPSGDPRRGGATSRARS